jgi:hypothetical protein
LRKSIAGAGIEKGGMTTITRRLQKKSERLKYPYRNIRRGIYNQDNMCAISIENQLDAGLSDMPRRDGTVKVVDSSITSALNILKPEIKALRHLGRVQVQVSLSKCLAGVSKFRIRI